MSAFIFNLSAHAVAIIYLFMVNGAAQKVARSYFVQIEGGLTQGRPAL